MVVLIPKFEMGIKYDLSQTLSYLGMSDIFHMDRANLHGIMMPSGEEYHGPNLYVSKASQDAYVKINEEGTEAAATTTIVTSFASSPPHFIADRPFIFIIQDDESGAILFMGRVSDHTA